MKSTWKSTLLGLSIAALSFEGAHALSTAPLDNPTPNAPSLRAPAVKLIKGKITKVTDGDTVWFEPNKGGNATAVTLKVRMIGMDTPETHLPSPNGVVGQQPWGDKAADNLASHIPVGSKVTLEDHGTDNYQRTLGRLLKGQTDVNLQQVIDGWASPYIICEGDDCDENFFENQNVEAYFAACEESRSRGRGIYSRKNPLDELPFEFRLRMGERTPDKWVGNYETKELYDPADYAEVDECNRVFFMRKKDAINAGFSERRPR